jgi:hypothetical protein
MLLLSECPAFLFQKVLHLVGGHTLRWAPIRRHFDGRCPWIKLFAWYFAENITASRGHKFFIQKYTRFTYLVRPPPIMTLLGSSVYSREQNLSVLR